MNQKAGVSKEYKKNFVLDETKLRKICDVLREHSAKLDFDTYINFYVSLEDDSFFETTNVDEVLQEDNAPGRGILNLLIEIRRTEPKEEENHKPELERKAIAAVAFTRSRENPLLFLVRGTNRDWCVLLADELDAQIHRVLTRGHYTLLSTHALDIVVFLLLGGLSLIGLSLVVYKLGAHVSLEEVQKMSMEDRTERILQLLNKRDTTFGVIGAICMICMAIVVAVVELRPLSRLVEKVRRSVFYWGDMVPIHDAFQKRMVQVKWGVGIAFLVSLLASIIGGLLMR